MLSETDRKEAPAPIPAGQVPLGPVPLPASEPTPPDNPQLRFFEHPEELQITGIVQMCPKCRARRNWLIILYLGHVWIRCRCSHEWHEPELTPADYAEMAGPQIKAWEDMYAVNRGLGYDGSLSGVYL